MLFPMFLVSFALVPPDKQTWLILGPKVSPVVDMGGLDPRCDSLVRVLFVR